MKKLISILLCAVMILSSGIVMAQTKTYDLSGSIPEGDSADFYPYPIALNATRYSPWYVQYARSTKAGFEAGLRGGDGNQRIMALAVSPVNPDHVLFGSDKSGIERSDDGGINWYCVGKGNNGWACTYIKWSNTDENVAYAMQTGNVGAASAEISKANNTSLHGIYKTYDAGKTWKQVLAARCLSNGCTDGVIEFGKVTGNVYALTTDGLFISTDDGEHFELQGTFMPADSGVYGLRISDDEKFMLAAGGGGVYYSTNKGLLWKNINGNLSDVVKTATSVDIDPDNEYHWVACFPDAEAGTILRETFDKGKTWTAMKVPNAKKTPQFVKFVKRSNGTVRMFVIHSKWGAPFWYSDDYGQTYKQNSFDRVDEQIYSPSGGYVVEGFGVCESNPELIYYSFGDEVNVSTDCGATFRWSNGGFSGINTNGITIDKEGYMWFADVDRGSAVTETPYAEKTYPAVRRVYSDAACQSLAVDPNDINHIYFSSTSGPFYESKDRCMTWTEVPVENVAANALIVFHNNDKNVIYTSSNTSYDGGKTWKANQYAIGAVSPVNNDILYSCTDKVLYKSTDRGVTWNKLADSGAATCMKADKFDENTVWFGRSNSTVYKCEGSTITGYGEYNGLKQDKDALYICNFDQDPKDKNHLVAGGKCTSGGVQTPGVWETYDGGETWVLVPGMKGTLIVNSITFSPISDEVFIGTCSNGFIVYDYKTFKKWYNGELEWDKSDKIIIENQYTDGRIRVKIDDDIIGFDVDPYLSANDRTLVPMRKIFEVLGAKIEWDDATETVTATKGNDVIKLTIGKNSAYINGEEKELQEPAQVTNDRTMVPLRFVAEALGCNVDWNDSNNLVLITSK